MQKTLIILLMLLSGILCALCATAGMWMFVRNRESSVLLTPPVLPTIAEAAPPTFSPFFTATMPSARQILQGEQTWFGEIYKKSSPSVVNITSRSYSYNFFLNVVPQEGTGSGFIWDEEGHIVTNFHVIEGAQELEVRFADGSLYPASIVGSDPSNDLAVIQVQKEGRDGRPTPLPLAKQTPTDVGLIVIAIGNPFGYERTLTSGIISALGRVIQSEDGSFIGEVIQHDAAINPGNSGGPLLNIDGEVIGVNTQIASPSGANAGIGFAIPIHTVMRVVPELITQKRYPHPWLGIEGFDMTPGFAERLRANRLRTDANEGVLVVGVYRDGPAENILQGGRERVRFGNLIVPIGGDLIASLDNQPISNQRAMLLYLESHKRVGDEVKVAFWRNGQLLEASITLAERPRQRR